MRAKHCQWLHAERGLNFWSEPPPLFRLEPCGLRWLTPGLRKCKCVFNLINRNKAAHIRPSSNCNSTQSKMFFPSDSCELTLDPNTVNKKIKLSDNNRKVSHVDEEQSYPDHPDRFDWCQLMCRDGLTGRCYWEVEWKGRLHIAVTYRGINRRGSGYDCLFGWNDQSWCLTCSKGCYSVCHNNRRTSISISSSSSSSSLISPSGSPPL